MIKYRPMKIEDYEGSYALWKNLEGLGLSSAHDGRRGYLHHLAVAKNHQKSGIGKNLFKLCFEKLAEVGIKKSHIFVVADNENAIQFWKKNGWEHRDYLIIMSKQVE